VGLLPIDETKHLYRREGAEGGDSDRPHIDGGGRERKRKGEKRGGTEGEQPK